MAHSYITQCIRMSFVSSSYILHIQKAENEAEYLVYHG